MKKILALLLLPSLMFGGIENISTNTATGHVNVSQTGTGGLSKPIDFSDVHVTGLGNSGLGTVTSVGLAAPNIFSVSGSPVTSSGTLTLSLATQSANRIWAGPTTGSAATPTFRALVLADIPDLSSLYGPPLTLGDLTDVGTDGITVTGGTGAVVGSGTSLAQHVADSTHNGYLSSSDWNSFNTAAGGGVTSSGNLSPLFTTSITSNTLNFSLSTAAANTVYGNNTASTATPVFSSAPRFLKIGNLTTNGFVKTGSSDGTLSVDTSSYITGNQTITLSGAISGSGTTTITTSLSSFTSADLAGALTNETGSGSAVFATSPTLVTPILGTPTSGTLTNCTGLPVASVVGDTVTALGVGTIELGHASNTTLSQSSAGVLAVEGVVVPTISSTNTLTNKRVVPRTHSTSSATSWTPDFDSYDEEIQTALAGAVTVNAPTYSSTNEGEKRILRIKDNGTARAITWNGAFRAGTSVALPTTTTISKTLYCGFMYNSTDSKWDLLAYSDGY